MKIISEKKLNSTGNRTRDHRLRWRYFNHQAMIKGDIDYKKLLKQVLN